LTSAYTSAGNGPCSDMLTFCWRWTGLMVPTMFVCRSGWVKVKRTITLLCGRNCQALLSAFLAFLGCTASLLVRIRLDLAQTGSVCEWGSCAPHSPCGCLHLLCTKCSPLSMALALCPCSEPARKTPDGRATLLGASPSGGLCMYGVLRARDAWDSLAPTTFYPCRQRLPPSTPSCMRSEAPREAPR
jgi:hypothetical protein